MSEATLQQDDDRVVASTQDEPFTPVLSPIEQAARALTAAMRVETSVARTGALPDFAAAADTKLKAFHRFSRLRTPNPTGLVSPTEHDAIRELIAAADESAIVLDAVRCTLNDVARRLSQALGSVADPGTYGRSGRKLRHTLAASVDATV